MVQNGDHKCKNMGGAQKPEEKTISEDETISFKVSLFS